MKGVCSQGEEVAWSVLFLPTVLLPIDIFEGTFFGGDLFGSQALSNVFEFERVLLLRVVGGARVVGPATCLRLPAIVPYTSLCCSLPILHEAAVC